MARIRVIPVLLFKGNGLVKSVRFKKYQYVGDALNAVRIFNEKEVDELIFLDICATEQGREPNYGLIREVASECFMPLAYGGGIRDVDSITKVLRCGVEKICINTAAVESRELVRKAAETAGSQSVVVSIDVRKTMFGEHRVWTRGGQTATSLDPDYFAKKAEQEGAGELLVNSIDRDGTMTGYDLDLINKVTRSVSIPVVACGGAGSLEDMVAAVRIGGASAVAAGSLFVFHGKFRAVLISYPSQGSLERAFAVGI